MRRVELSEATISKPLIENTSSIDMRCAISKSPVEQHTQIKSFSLREFLVLRISIHATCSVILNLISPGQL